jgi:hypothetical protein
MLEETTSITVYIYIDNKFYSITEKQFFGGPEEGRIVTVFFLRSQQTCWVAARSRCVRRGVDVRNLYGRRNGPSLRTA